jgi:ribosomal 30S subunit maturation factor RimM
MRQALIQDIDARLEDGMAVFDLNNEKIGDVKMYSTAAGYLMVGSGVLEERDLYLPFRLIRTITPDAIFMSATRATIEAQYSERPQARTIVETRLAAGPGGNMTPQTREVQVLPSGYDNTPLELNAVEVNSVADRLAVGMVVYDVDGKRLGDIIQYDDSRARMVVEKGIFKPRDLVVPFSAIEDIDMDSFKVHLSVGEDSLLPTGGQPHTSP